MNPKYTHSAREHLTADAWVDPLLNYIKSDAFTDEDRPLTYQGAIDRFSLPTFRGEGGTRGALGGQCLNSALRPCPFAPALD